MIAAIVGLFKVFKEFDSSTHIDFAFDYNVLKGIISGTTGTASDDVFSVNNYVQLGAPEAIKFISGENGGVLNTGQVYYASGSGSYSSAKFVLYTDEALTSVVDLTSNIGATEFRRSSILQSIQYLSHNNSFSDGDNVIFTFSRIAMPFSKPNPRKLSCEERFALSKEDLNTKGTFSLVVMSCSCPATSMTNCSLSITHGPAIRNKG